MKNLPILTVLFLATAFAQPGLDVPTNMSFQGFLTDFEGVPYEDGEYDLTFRLIRQIDATTEQTIWEEFHSASVTNGVFSVILGSVTPLPLSISPNVQLETQVGDEILSPRQPLTSVPFALKSSRAQQALQAVLSDTAQYALYARHAQISDTATVSLNAPMADTAQYAINANQSELSIQSTYSDTAQFAQLAETAGQAIEADTATLSHHSVYADTANYALGIVGGIENGQLTFNDIEHALYEHHNQSIYLGYFGNFNPVDSSGIFGNHNAVLGWAAYLGDVPTPQTGYMNTAIGNRSLLRMTGGYRNVGVGYLSGGTNINGVGNIFIGAEAGNNEAFSGVSNRLIIANDTTSSPLIDGDFSSSSLTINGDIVANSFNGDGSGLTGIVSEIATNSIYADTANYALGIVGGIEVDDVQNATYADTAYYVEQAQSALTANEATSAINSTYADTAYFVQESQSSLLANEALIANNSTYADTAQYVAQAQSALTADESNFANSSTYSDTAAYIDLSVINQNISINHINDARLSINSSSEGGSSQITLTSRPEDAHASTLSIINDGNTDGISIYDVNSASTLMTVSTSGNISATSFTGDGSGLTGVSAGDFETRLIDYSFDLEFDADIWGMTLEEIIGSDITYGTITMLGVENFNCNDCDAGDGYSVMLRSYDSSFDGSTGISMSQSIAYEYHPNSNTFFLSGYHITINPSINLFHLRSNNHATSGILKLMVTGIF